MIERGWTSLKNRLQAGQDADFDELGGWLEENLYGTSAGDVRLAVLWEDLLATIPQLVEGRLRVLDAGGGSGRIAIRLAQLGNSVVLCDPSREMLRRAQAAIREAGLADEIMVVQARIQEIARRLGEPFDVITCHAVLEWLAEPGPALIRLTRALAPEGRLSLMFYNRNAWLLKRVLRGEFAEVLADPTPDSTRALHEPRLRFRRLAGLPTGWSRAGWGDEGAPLSEAMVREWLREAGLVVHSKAGIRVFHDLLSEDARSLDRLDELVAVENTFRSTEPFASLGQLVHLVAARVLPSA